MSEKEKTMRRRFVSADRKTPQMFPPTIEEYLPEDHLARFVVEIVEQLDLRRLTEAYSGRGSAAYHPGMKVALLFYGYATGTFSSRKLEKATYDSVAYRYICANSNPDHDSINRFRKRFGKELGVFVCTDTADSGTDSVFGQGVGSVSSGNEGGSSVLRIRDGDILFPEA